jgi:hypothetical protein
LRALHLRDKCLRKAGHDKDPAGQLLLWQGIRGTVSYSERMKRAIDSERGSGPVWRTLRHGGAGVWQHPPQQGAGSLHLRGQRKVDTQWKLYCLVHNIEKLAHHGYAQ